MNRNIRTYTGLIQLQTFNERFDYLKLSGNIGVESFGLDRYLNQSFYKSKEWKDVRKEVILRDSACDLGIIGLDIFKNIIVHHMNPISIEDIEVRSDILLDPNYLITVSLNTHNNIHFGREHISFKERRAGDTTPWKKF